MMFNTKGDGFPNDYDDPARLEEYRGFYLEHFNRFFRHLVRMKLSVSASFARK